MARKKTELNLQAELPEVRSTDFNLFYKPQEEPVDDSITNFTKSLDNFINGAGTGLVLQAEKKEKELNEAEAIEQFNKNRKGFSDAVNSGDIPKEANPYFIEKYKELTLNKAYEKYINSEPDAYKFIAHEGGYEYGWQGHYIPRILIEVMTSYIMAGREKEARQFLDYVWPDHLTEKELFVSLLKERIESSDYWEY